MPKDRYDGTLYETDLFLEYNHRFSKFTPKHCVLQEGIEKRIQAVEEVSSEQVWYAVANRTDLFYGMPPFTMDIPWNNIYCRKDLVKEKPLVGTTWTR